MCDEQGTSWGFMGLRGLLEGRPRRSVCRRHMGTCRAGTQPGRLGAACTGTCSPLHAHPPGCFLT